MTEQYQDLWLDGLIESKGERECASRYDLVRQFCVQYSRPFTVLDIGANLGYFCLRLTEEFADCTAVALESDPAIGEVLRRNNASCVILLQKHFTLEDLRAIAACEHFDVVLGLSVIHHFEGSFAERLEVFRSLGDHLILELAVEDEACGGEQKAFTVPDGAQMLGYGDSHLCDGVKRPIYLLSRMKTTLVKAYIGSPREDLSLAIYSDFLRKRVHFYNKPESRDWLRGLNLRTYDLMGGFWPEREMIARHLEAHGSPKNHLDVKPWNVLLMGDDSVLIDAGDRNMTEHYPDSEYFHRLIRWLRGDQIEWPM